MKTIYGSLLTYVALLAMASASNAAMIFKAIPERAFLTIPITMMPEPQTQILALICTMAPKKDFM